jgi:hypothetical protein
MLMNMHPYFRTLIILAGLFLITYSLAQGIKNGNLLGTILASGSMCALAVCIHLDKKLAETIKEEEKA